MGPHSPAGSRRARGRDPRVDRARATRHVDQVRPPPAEDPRDHHGHGPRNRGVSPVAGPRGTWGEGPGARVHFRDQRGTLRPSLGLGGAEVKGLRRGPAAHGPRIAGRAPHLGSETRATRRGETRCGRTGELPSGRSDLDGLDLGKNPES